MSVACSNDEIEILKQFIGTKLNRITGHKYPNVAGYERLVLYFDNGTNLLIELRSHSIQFKFEVFVVKVSVINENGRKWPFGVDEILFHNFEVATIDTIQRLEWTELGPSQLKLDSPPEMKADVNLNSEPVRSESIQVDVGLVIVSLTGEKLVFEAGAFPMVFEFDYRTGSVK
jgi:hypothetical protein